MTAAAHRIRWFGISDGERIPRNRHMRDRDWGWDVECSCGWRTRTGGAIAAYIDALAMVSSVRRWAIRHVSDVDHFSVAWGTAHHRSGHPAGRLNTAFGVEAGTPPGSGQGVLRVRGGDIDMSEVRTVEVETDRPDIVRAYIHAQCHSGDVAGVEINGYVEYTDGRRWSKWFDFWPGYTGKACGGWTLEEGHWDRVLGRHADELWVQLVGYGDRVGV